MVSNRNVSYSNLEIVSYSGGSFLQEFISTVFGGWIFFFYETEVGLDSFLITLGFMVYAIWNAFNSPLIGHYTNKSIGFTRRWGRHFPWIIISSLPWFISLFFLYTPLIKLNSNTNLWMFIWFILFICLYSFFFSIFGVNYGSLFPKKFSSDSVRRKASGIIGGISFAAMGIGTIFPALIIQFKNIKSYSLMALLSILIAIFVLLLTVPGIREKKENLKRYSNNNRENKLNFLKNLRFALKQRNFVVIVIIYFLNLIIMRSVGAALPYATKYIFNAPSYAIAFISIGYILGAVISMPFWTKLGDIINNNRLLFMISCVFLSFSQLFLLFVSDVILAIFAAFLYGFTLAGFWTLLSMPLTADVLDEIAVKSKARNENVYLGIRGFFVNFSVVAQAAIFAFIHKVTGFVENTESQTILAQWGIRFTLALAPLICTIIVFIIFWKFYDLLPDKVKKIKKRLEELKL